VTRLRAGYRRFVADVRALGVDRIERADFRSLVEAYRAPDRYYHTLSHIAACLDALDGVANLAQHPAEIAVALWFHDAVYDTHRTDNEERSAVWAREYLTGALAHDAIDRIEAMILATRHTEHTAPGDTALMVDIDLGILGQPVRVFDRYDAAIRREYAWVSDEAYREGRRAVLASFLARTRIYCTDFFHARLEGTARANLARAHDRLGAS
jgi:predicted metal-dependent HD superfamily phosphohydrolase